MGNKIHQGDEHRTIIPILLLIVVLLFNQIELGTSQNLISTQFDRNGTTRYKDDADLGCKYNAHFIVDAPLDVMTDMGVTLISQDQNTGQVLYRVIDGWVKQGLNSAFISLANETQFKIGTLKCLSAVELGPVSFKATGVYNYDPIFETLEVYIRVNDPLNLEYTCHYVDKTGVFQVCSWIKLTEDGSYRVSFSRDVFENLGVIALKFSNQYNRSTSLNQTSPLPTLANSSTAPQAIYQVDRYPGFSPLPSTRYNIPNQIFLLTRPLSRPKGYEAYLNYFQSETSVHATLFPISGKYETCQMIYTDSVSPSLFKVYQLQSGASPTSLTITGQQISEQIPYQTALGGKTIEDSNTGARLTTIDANYGINGGILPTFTFIDDTRRSMPTPFGITNIVRDGNILNYRVSFPAVNSTNNPPSLISTYLGTQQLIQNNPTLAALAADTTSGEYPIITDLNILFENLNTITVSIEVYDPLHTVHSVQIFGKRLDYTNIISGTPQQPIYQATIYIPLPTPLPDFTISIYNLNNQVSTWKSGYVYDFKYSKVPFYPFFSIENITSFQFSTSSINTSISDVQIQLRVGVKNNGSLWSPTLRLLKPLEKYYAKNGVVIPEEDKTYFYGTWDENLFGYLFTITVPVGYYQGKLDYYIFFSGWDATSITDKFPKSEVQVINNNGDNVGPFLTAIQSNQVDLEKDTSLTLVTLKFNITDQGTGFSSGTIVLLSEWDLTEYTLQLDSKNRIDGTAQSGQYQTNITIYRCPTRSFSIKSIKFVDRTGNVNSVNRWAPDHSINPYILMYQSPDLQPNYIAFNTECSSKDTTAPQLIDLDFSPKELLSVAETNVKFTLTTADETALSTIHHPTIYITNAMGDILSFPLTQKDIISQNKTVCTYTTQVTIPFVFGFGCDVVLISVYGIIDAESNPKGYSSYDLTNTLELKYSMKAPSMSFLPSIVSYDGLTSEGGVVTIRAINFDPKEPIIGFFDLMNGQPPLQLTGVNEEINSKTLRVLFTLPKLTTNKCLLKVKNGGTWSNALVLDLNDYTFDQTLFPCPGQCNGKGNCTKSGCVCYEGYTGSDCQSQITDVVVETGSNSPSINITTKSDSKSQKASAFISIIELREYDIDGGLLVSYPLDNWNLIDGDRVSNTYTNSTPVKISSENNDNQTTSNTNSQSLVYSLMVGNNQTQINTTIQYYTNAQTIQFGYDTLQMQEHMVKYTISMSKYTMKSPLNRLVLVIDGYLQSTDQDEDSCSSKQDGHYNGDKNEVSWYQLRVNDISLYARFIKSALADKRTVYVSNIVLDETVDVEKMGTTEKLSSQSRGTRVGIYLPYYTESMIIDPQWATILSLEQDDSSTKTCTSQKKSKLSRAIIIGVSVGSVAGAVFIGATIYATIKYKYWLKYKLSKLSKK